MENHLKQFHAGGSVATSAFAFAYMIGLNRNYISWARFGIDRK